MFETVTSIPSALRIYFSQRYGDKVFRRRVVQSFRTKTGKVVNCCVVELIFDCESASKETKRFNYPDAVLFEDWLSGAECDEFVKSLIFTNTEIAEGIGFTPQRRSWEVLQLPFMNQYMERAGCVASFEIRTDSGTQSHAPLLGWDQEFYPDIFAATRDWLGLREYHGENDGRNQKVMFLLPEDHAFIKSAEQISDGLLKLNVAGSLADKGEFAIVGASWVGSRCIQIRAEVTGGQASAYVADDADRLELYLIDKSGQIYDFHKEGKFEHCKRQFLRSPKMPAENRVKTAIEEGEGKRIEFKPFVIPDQKLTENKVKTKLAEILTSIVAFANSDGGSVYIGVDDDCQVVGIDQKLSEWGHAQFSEALAVKYAGALKSAIKDNIEGEINVTVSPVSTEAGTVIVIDVTRSASRPVNLKDNHVLFVRNGASNRKLPPSQWPAILRSDTAREALIYSAFSGGNLVLVESDEMSTRVHEN